MKSTIHQWTMATAIVLAALAALAVGALPPAALVQSVTKDVMSILREDKAIQQGDQARARELIETKIAPHFDFERMTSLAVGRAWRTATPEQRTQLTDEFRTLLVNTYANSLAAYKDQTVSFRPAGDPGEQTEVTIRSQINTPGKQPISLNYALAKSAAGEWKVFDVVVADVSLVTSYRSSFASETSSGGIEGLIKALQAKNRAREGPNA